MRKPQSKWSRMKEKRTSDSGEGAGGDASDGLAGRARETGRARDRQ